MKSISKAIIEDMEKMFLKLENEKKETRKFRDYFFYWKGLIRMAQLDYGLSDYEAKMLIKKLLNLSTIKKKTLLTRKEYEVFKGK